MVLSFLRSLENKTWLAVFFCIIPVVIYALFFNAIALNVNYVAFDDIIILSIIPNFGDADWPERWKLLTQLFPEHRLVFSRSIILLLYQLFGKVNLVWPMIIANICWAFCAVIFYRAFLWLRLSIWYYLPVIWLWFNIQSFENIFWGVSSLCNFGVILSALAAFYVNAFHPQRIFLSILLAIAATFTYGNGLMVFLVLGFMHLIAGRYKGFFATLLIALIIAGIYFIDFTPITQSLDITDPGQVKDGIGGFFGFIGSIATITAYGIPTSGFYSAVAAGVIMIFLSLFLFRNQFILFWKALRGKASYINPVALFSIAIFVFTGITALALTYKRIPTDTFEGMFKGRYRMYSTMWCIGLYLSYLALGKKDFQPKPALLAIPVAIILNLVILHGNFADAVNNRRAAITQEFNARYNPDWLGLRMFSMDTRYFETIRSYYKSKDPLAEGWDPIRDTKEIPCDSMYAPDKISTAGDYLTVNFEKDFFKADKDFTDGAYVLLKSENHLYASPPNQYPVPLKTTLRRLMYFSKGAFASFHLATVEPGTYKIYLLARKNGLNRIYCTGTSWTKPE